MLLGLLFRTGDRFKDSTVPLNGFNERFQHIAIPVYFSAEIRNKEEVADFFLFQTSTRTTQEEISKIEKNQSAEIVIAFITDYIN
jgi:hypothetical protein